MPQRVYIDASVFVCFYANRLQSDFGKLSKSFLEKVEQGKYEGVVSLFGLMELVKQIRELMVKSGNCKKGDWDDACKKAIESIYKISNIKIVEGEAGDRKGVSTTTVFTHGEIVREGFEIMLKYQGSPKQSEDGYEHDGIHPIDALHIVLAKKLGCERIATFDRDFDETRYEVEPLLLQRDVI